MNGHEKVVDQKLLCTALVADGPGSSASNFLDEGKVQFAQQLMRAGLPNPIGRLKSSPSGLCSAAIAKALSSLAPDAKRAGGPPSVSRFCRALGLLGCAKSAEAAIGLSDR